MAFLTFFALLVGGVFVVGGIAFGASFAANRNASDRSVVSSLKSELKATRSNENIATKALRSIANGAGNPILEASDALDRINDNEIKELN